MEMFSYAYVVKNKYEIAILYSFWGVLGFPCCAWGLSSCCVWLLLIVVVSHAAEHGLQGMQTSVVIAHGLGSCGPQALVAS